MSRNGSADSITISKEWIDTISGCWPILDGDQWSRLTEKEYAVNPGKVIRINNNNQNVDRKDPGKYVPW